MLKQLIGGILVAAIMGSATAYVDVQRLKVIVEDLKVSLLTITKDSNDRIKRIEDILLERRE
jgi:hypothetical protein